MLCAIYRAFVTCYGISLFIFGIRNSLFMFVFRLFIMSYSLFKRVVQSFFFSNNTFLCCNKFRIECYYMLCLQQKIYSKSMKSLS